MIRKMGECIGGKVILCLMTEETSGKAVLWHMGMKASGKKLFVQREIERGGEESNC